MRVTLVTWHLRPLGAFDPMALSLAFWPDARLLSASVPSLDRVPEPSTNSTRRGAGHAVGRAALDRHVVLRLVLLRRVGAGRLGVPATRAGGAGAARQPVSTAAATAMPTSQVRLRTLRCAFLINLRTAEASGSKQT